MGEIACSMCIFNLCVAAEKPVYSALSLRYSFFVGCLVAKQPTKKQTSCFYKMGDFVYSLKQMDVLQFLMKFMHVYSSSFAGRQDTVYGHNVNAHRSVWPDEFSAHPVPVIS